MREDSASTLSSRAVVLLGSYVWAGGLASLLAWILNVPRLADWDRDGIAIQPNAALCAVLCGMALALQSRGHRKLLVGLGSAVTGIGLATLLEHLTKIDLRIDTLLMFGRTWGSEGTVTPGRMGPPGSLSWSILGLSLVLLGMSGRRARLWVPRLGLFVLFIASFSLIGYVYGDTQLYLIPRLTAIAWQTATFILAMGLGIIAALPEHEPMRTLSSAGTEGVLARRVLPLLIGIPVFLGYVRLKTAEAELMTTQTGIALMVLTMIVLTCTVLWWGLSAVSEREKARRKADQASQAVIREIHKREEALSRAETQHRLVGDLIPYGVWSADLDGNATYLSPLFLEMTGQTLEQHRNTWMTLIHPEDARPTVEAWQACVGEGGMWEHEFRIRGRDGNYRTILARGVPVKDAGDHVISYAGFNYDITARRQMEDALREADRNKSEFLAVLSHELRHPLAPMVNALGILDRAEGDPVLMERCRAMLHRQLQHLTRLVDDLLDIGRISSNKLELRLETLDLALILDQVVETWRPTADEANLTLTCERPHDPLFIRGDRVRISQVLGNLLANSCRYSTPGGSIHLEAQPENDQAVITVRDQGVGIPAHMLDKIFEPFIQVEGMPHQAQHGLGLGLSLVKRLVELQGGGVSARSDGPDQGSTFTVRLPLAPAPERVSMFELSRG